MTKGIGMLEHQEGYEKFVYETLYFLVKTNISGERD